MNIVLLGAPGAGKDTLADQLEEEYDYEHITPGYIFRTEAYKETELGLWARDTYWGKGQLVPDEVTNKLVSATYEDTDHNKHIIFNGFPRTVAQAEYTASNIGVGLVLCLDVDEDVAIERLLYRGREDDNEEVIRERFKVFNKNNEQIKSFFRGEGTPVVDIDASSSIERVFTFAFKNIVNFIP